MIVSEFPKKKNTFNNIKCVLVEEFICVFMKCFV